MSNTNAPQTFLGTMIFGAIFFIVGAFVVLLAAGIIPSDESSFNAPRWVIGAVGLVFMLAGTMVALQGAFAPDPESSLLYLWLMLIIGTALMLLFSSVFLWVGLGPGEREFSTTTTIGAVSASGQGSETSGRVIFGGGGMLMLLFTALMAYGNWKKIRDFEG